MIFDDIVAVVAAVVAVTVDNEIASSPRSCVYATSKRVAAVVGYILFLLLLLFHRPATATDPSPAPSPTPAGHTISQWNGRAVLQVVPCAPFRVEKRPCKNHTC